MKTKRKSPQVDIIRGMALEIIYQVMEKGAFANLLLDQQLRNTKLPVNDRRLITELVNGTIRMIKHLDWVLNLFLKMPADRQNPWLRNILRLALYQILFMDKIPGYASVDSAVKLARAKAGAGLASVANGVLRNILRNPDKIKYPSPEQETAAYLAVYYSHPQWLVEEWLAAFGYDQTKSILAYNNRPADLTIRCNRIKTTPDELKESLQEEGILSQTDNNLPWALKIIKMDNMLTATTAFEQGWFYIQNSASMLAAPILQLQPGQSVYDLCCGVGGKATLIAEYMENQGCITAIDVYDHKVDLLRHNSRRLGIDIIKAQTEDLLQIDASQIKKASRVMLDAPCSGLGVLNRRADARWKHNLPEIQTLVKIQQDLLNVAAPLVLKEGILLYSTCTINPAENLEVVEAFLHTHPEFSLDGFEQEINFLPLEDKDYQDVAQGWLTLLPGKYNTDGMFYARMRRN